MNKSEGLWWKLSSRWACLLAQNTSHPLGRIKAGGEKGLSKGWVVLDLGEGIWISNEIILSIFNLNILAYFFPLSKNALETI